MKVKDCYDTDSMLDNYLAQRYFLSWYFSKKCQYVFDVEPWNERAFAQLIASGHSSLFKDIDSSLDDSLKLNSYSLAEFNDSDYHTNNSYLYPVLLLKEYVNEHLKNDVFDFIVHGSISSLDYAVGWSDLDTLVIIKDEVLLNADASQSFRRKLLGAIDFLYKIDPLQHHEFIITSESAWVKSGYKELPLEILKFSKSLLGQLTHDLAPAIRNENPLLHLARINDLFSQSFKKGYLDHHKKDGIALREDFADRNTMYQLKYFLAIIMTLPAYFMDAIGRPMYKGESFFEFKKIIDCDLELLDKASDIRRLWALYEQHPYRGNEIPNWVVSILGSGYFGRAHRLSSFLVDAAMRMKNFDYLV